MKGFYLAGLFPSSGRSKFMVLNQRQKPFEVDTLRGEVKPKAIPVFSKNHRYAYADEWEFIEGFSIKDIDVPKNKELRVCINAIWFRWCQKYRRKTEALLIEDMEK